MKLLRRAYFILFYSLPAVLFFSYYPVIRLGSNATMNFELSLPLIWLILFDLIAFASLIAYRDSKQTFSISDRKFFLFALFPLYATLSIFWSANSTRAILTAGIIWLLFFAVFAIIYITPLLKPKASLRLNLLKTCFLSSAIICLICWLQAILDAFGIDRELTLLCPGCISQTFGFPHPSGFAIEPQFMGNLLLAPTLAALYFLIFRRQALKSHQFRILLALAGLFTATIFLTFSRGAIYAFAVALVILLIFALAKHCFRPTLIIVPVVTFIFTLMMQGIFNAVGPIHGSFCSGATKSLHQLSLGVIDLRSACPSLLQTETSEPDAISAQNISTAHPTSMAEQPTFDGYVAESTDIRLNLNSAAIKTWFNRYNILFGVGLGGAGTALYKNRSITNVATPKEIVQNQPLSLLLELGLVGIILIVFSLLLAFCPQIFPAKLINGKATKPAPTFWQHPALPLLVSLIIAYAITLQFFSGLPNALQIYLLPPLFYFILLPEHSDAKS